MVERAGKEAQHKRENFQDAVLEARDKKQRQRARDLQNQVCTQLRLVAAL